MPIHPAKEFVLARFNKSRIHVHPTSGRFRVFLQWRYEPDLGWCSTRERAWMRAQKFLETYPNNSRVNRLDPARRADACL